MPFVEFEVTADHIIDGQDPKNTSWRVFHCPATRAIQAKLKTKAYATSNCIAVFPLIDTSWGKQEVRMTVSLPENVVAYIRRADVQHAALVQNRPLEEINILAEPLQPMKFSVQFPDNIYRLLEFNETNVANETVATNTGGD